MRPAFAGLLVCVVLSAFVTSSMPACKSTQAAGVNLAATCAINTDCDNPLICAFGHCHNQCTSVRDCPPGADCVASGATGVCLLPSETTCSTQSPCANALVCVGTTCHGACTPSTSTGDCLPDQICESEPGNVSACITDIAQDGGPLGDGATGDATAVDGASSEGGPTDGGSKDTGGVGDGGADDGSDAMACATPETTFGNMAQGDSNPNFTAAVGVRTASSLLVFSSYNGPGVGGFDAGSSGGAVNLIWSQEFDPASGLKSGPAKPLFQPPPNATVIRVMDASIAPTGEIVLLYAFGSNGYFYDYGSTNGGGGGSDSPLAAAFFAAPDAGAALSAPQKIVTLETGDLIGQPHVLWSPSTSEFVMSWSYNTGGPWFVKIKRFTADGSAASGGTDIVPSGAANDSVAEDIYQDNGAIAESNGLLGIAMALPGQSLPELVALNGTGTVVGAPLAVEAVEPQWMATGGVSKGFVYFTDATSTVNVFFIPPADVDAGDAGTLSEFTFPQRAIDARVLNDNTGGAGGVGAALLYDDGLSFAYVQSSGTMGIAPSQVLPHTYAPGDVFNLSQFGGSFAVTLYSGAMHSAQIQASACQ